MPALSIVLHCTIYLTYVHESYNNIIVTDCVLTSSVNVAIGVFLAMSIPYFGACTRAYRLNAGGEASAAN